MTRAELKRRSHRLARVLGFELVILEPKLRGQFRVILEPQDAAGDVLAQDWTGPNLNPSDDPPPASQTLSSSGCVSTMKFRSTLLS